MPRSPRKITRPRIPGQDLAITFGQPVTIDCSVCGRIAALLETFPYHLDGLELEITCPDGHAHRLPGEWLGDSLRWPTHGSMTLARRFYVGRRATPVQQPVRILANSQVSEPRSADS